MQSSPLLSPTIRRLELHLATRTLKGGEAEALSTAKDGGAGPRDHIGKVHFHRSGYRHLLGEIDYGNILL